MVARVSYGAIEDRYLVAATLAGSGEAYDELIRRYRGAVTLLAWKILGSREAAQDAAQEAFVAAFQQLGRLKDANHFGPWLRVIAQNCARRLSRKERNSRSVESEQIDLLLNMHDCDRVCNPGRCPAEKGAGQRHSQPDRGTSGGRQDVLQLYYAEQWSVAQIAEFLSLTKTTVKWRLHSGRRHVARELNALAEV